MNIIEKARQVLKIESEGINAISAQLDERFEQLVRDCLEVLAKNGKLVLFGIGKSGQIAQKLASTLSSTGSRASFIHPVEALHGDLGMIHPADLCLALSYSGETEELLNLLPSVRRMGNKIVGITGDENSSLAKYSDLVIPCKIAQEACPFNLAPTTTTTAMLALGDSLAMVLMELNGFKLHDYGQLHPSGSIGRSVTLKVSDIMRTGIRLAVVSPETKVQDAILAMCRSKGGTVLIGDEKQILLGIYTTGDLKRSLSQDPQVLTKSVKEVMVKNPIKMKVDQMAVSVLDILREKDINAIPVVNNLNEIQGVVDIQDLPKFKML